MSRVLRSRSCMPQPATPTTNAPPTGRGRIRITRRALTEYLNRRNAKAAKR